MEQLDYVLVGHHYPIGMGDVERQIASEPEKNGKIKRRFTHYCDF